MSAALPDRAYALLNGEDCAYSPWATACAIGMYARNAGFTEDEFIRLVSESHFAWIFSTEDGGRDRSNRLTSRLVKVWDRVEDGWNPPIGKRDDVRQRLAALSQRISEHRWTGKTASKDRAVALGLVAWAHEIGAWTVAAGTRELALRSGVAHGTAKRALHRLAAIGLISRDETYPKLERTHSQRWVLDMSWDLTVDFDPLGLTPGGESYKWVNLGPLPSCVSG